MSTLPSLSAPVLNRWQRREMRAAARAFVRDGVPSQLAAAICHRELSFVSRPMAERLRRATA